MKETAVPQRCSRTGRFKFRNEVLHYLPKGQRLLAATQWPAILGGFRRELAPAGALLVTERELVLIADEKAPDWYHGEREKYGGITLLPTASRFMWATKIASVCAPRACKPRRRKAKSTPSIQNGPSRKPWSNAVAQDGDSAAIARISSNRRKSVMSLAG
jgi:hypothetical protein